MQLMTEPHLPVGWFAAGERSQDRGTHVFCLYTVTDEQVCSALPALALPSPPLPSHPVPSRPFPSPPRGCLSGLGLMARPSLSWAPRQIPSLFFIVKKRCSDLQKPPGWYNGDLMDPGGLKSTCPVTTQPNSVKLREGALLQRTVKGYFALPLLLVPLEFHREKGLLK